MSRVRKQTWSDPEFRAKRTAALRVMLTERNKKMSRPIADRFWEKVDKRGPDECWLWTGTTNGRGYGMLWDRTCDRGAHRIAWEITVGPIEAGLEIDHLCRVRACVNPAHLEPVTTQENLRRRTAALQAAKLMAGAPP